MNPSLPSAKGYFRLTRPICEILLHRLEADIIPEVLEDSEFNPPIGADEARDAQELLIKRVAISNEIDILSLGRVGLEVFRDAIDGSTFFGSMDDAVDRGELSKGKALSYQKAANEIEDQFTAITGDRIFVPRV